MGVSLGTAEMVDNIGTTYQSVKTTVVTVQVIAKDVGNGRGGGEKKGGPVLLRECVFGPDLRHSRRRTGPPGRPALERLFTNPYKPSSFISPPPHVLIAAVLVGLGICNHTPPGIQDILAGWPTSPPGVRIWAPFEALPEENWATSLVSP